jgi:hypothetical protein
MTLTGTLEVICTIPAGIETQGTIDFTQWTRDGQDLPQFDGVRQILVSCSPGETFVIGLTVGFDPDDPAAPPGLSMGSTSFTCRGKPPRVTSLECGPYRTQYLVCETRWVDGADPSRVQYVGYSTPNAPVVTTDPVRRISTLRFRCLPGNVRIIATVIDSIDQRGSGETTAACPQ